MPGGLASWLGDDEAAIKAKLPRRPRQPSRVAAAPVIDVDAASPGATAAAGGKTNRLRAVSGKDAWDPFSSKGTREDASQNAFALLRKGAAAAKPPATSTASTPSPPAWREGSRPPASSWDPFGAPLADGKENRGNAFSKLLAAPASQHHSTQRNSSGGPGKKTKLTNSSSGGGGSPEADAVTRFCECPVCGKRVIIELCSKHLDTECSGLKIDAGPPVSRQDGPGSGESLPSATLTPTSSAVAVSEGPAPRERHTASVPSVGSPVGSGKARSDTDSRAALPLTSAVAALPTIDDPGRPGKNPDCSVNAGGEASGKGVARNPLTPAAATAAAKSTASRRRKASSGAPPSLRSGRKGTAGGTAAAAAAEAKAMTTCPVCGQHVQADLCSWHLDHECAGVTPAPAASSPACEGKSTGGVGESKGQAGREEGKGEAEEAAREKDAGSEATGGLNALAAELTCPVCLCVFEDVHSLPCSHRFCRECIMGCFKSSKRQECPLCKIPAWKRDLTRDVSLQNIILAYRRMAPP